MYINLQNGTKKYGKGESEVFALNKANFALDAGQLAVVLGPSGSGKSTLLNVLGGLSTLDEGTLTVGEYDLTTLKGKALTNYRRKEVGFVFQSYNLIPDLTVKENVEVAADVADEALNIDELLASLDMADYAHRFPRELSGGQQQRVAIARAMVKKPKLLLCDELTGALDTKASKVVLSAIQKMNADYGTTVVIITHNEGIAAMADVVARLRDGAVSSCTTNEKKISAKELML